MELGQAMYMTLPYAVMTLRNLSLAGLMAMLRSTLDPAKGVNSVVLTVYQQLASASVLVFLSLLLDRRRMKPSLQILSLTCLIGFLQITVAEILLTSSLRYITAAVQSIGLNMIPVVVFVLAILAGRETFEWGSLYGQAKLWGVFASAIGASMVILASDSNGSAGGGTDTFDGFWIGVMMVAAAVLVLSTACLLVEKVALQYSSDITLSAMMNVFGTVQTVIVAALIVRDPSSWKINIDSLELPVILFGGIVTTGIFYFGSNWCIHKKGPVFGAAFSPLLVVISFLFDILFFQSKINIKRLQCSVIGAILVVGGLYLLLWAKSREHGGKASPTDRNETLQSSSTEVTEPLIIESRA